MNRATEAQAKAFSLKDEADKQRQEALKQKRETLRTQSLFLTDLAKQETERDNAITGILLALEALPKNDSKPDDRPSIAEAETQLYESLTYFTEQLQCGDDLYEVHFYKGDYNERQKQANQDNCVAYVEHHFNNVANSTTSYAVAITSYLASDTTKQWGRWYANKVSKEFNIPVIRIFLAVLPGIKVS